ncbi:DUF2804 domain-containing protein [Noviherbaspirillum sp. UKPF54]|uniref:DUF2804 domain-containing protein n=1 Tax=Noviherbaspirillum sp. UKPF54 TaxID=2601898 RepID=UPI0011B0F7AA|nr:DUF2804 domain-containing protein [Noviherbaspirillum sp. UKPF54]QDZ29764.1 DUF2804 domain-containing protein [Noviherbaspirillum sp. UKPF54]
MPLSTPLAQTADAPLPPAPPAVPDADGHPRFGRFAGATAAIDWTRLAAPYARGALWRHFHHKRWQYVALATEELFCGIAIVDLGWTSTAFAYVFDRIVRAEVAGYSQNGLPGLGARVAAQAGGESTFRWPGSRIDFRARDGEYRLSLRCRGFEIDAGFSATDSPLLLAVGPVDGGSVHATQKSPGMPLTGEVRVAGRRYGLDGGVASFDYSNGLLARETSWQWASAHSLALGFNLQAGYFGNHENALWLDGRLIPLGQARFDYDRARPLAPWQVRTDDGLLDLQFTPEGARREDKNLLVAASRYIQPIGHFSGWVKAAPGAAPRRVERLVGVTEDHYSRW